MDNYNISYALTEVANQLKNRKGLMVPTGHGYQQWTFQQLEDHASADAHGLAGLGIDRNDRAVLMVKPSMEFICLTFALFRLGTPVILIDPGMGYRNLLRCISSVEPTVFIGIPKAQIFRKIFPKPFITVSKSICVGPSFGVLGKSLASITRFDKGEFSASPTTKNDLAAIIFTTGSTGPPKGVRYSHGNFHAQLEIIRDYYKITSDDIDQPAFPLFALFSMALGACAVLPDMDAAQPAQVDPERFIKSINEFGVTYSFGSPAIWNVVSRYCLNNGIVLKSLRQVLMAGAPVPGELIERVSRILPNNAEIQTPYGATESLPVTSMSGKEIVEQTWELSRQGKGTCVGRPIPGIDLKIIRFSDGPYRSWKDVEELPYGEIGEIVVRGDVVTHVYDNNNRENKLAKIIDGETFWHRIGDLGYLDAGGMLWFCGRKAHRVTTEVGVLFTIQCEAIFNEHPNVYRSALVGIKAKANTHQTPVLIVEPQGAFDKDKLLEDLNELAKRNNLTSSIEHFLVHKSFPVDIRHNAKIFREKLAVWAAEQLKGKRGLRLKTEGK